VSTDILTTVATQRRSSATSVDTRGIRARHACLSCSHRSV